MKNIHGKGTGTWYRMTVAIDPWSYARLVRRWERLKKGRPGEYVSLSAALRHILKRTRN